MLYERPDFLYQVPAAMVLVQFVFVLAVKAMLSSLRWMGRASWSARPVARRLVTFAVIGLVAVTPIVVLLVIVFALLVTAVAFGAYSVVVMTRWGRVRFVEPRVRSRLRTMPADGAERSTMEREPFLIRSWARELGKLGFSRVATQSTDGIVRAAFLQPELGVIADVLWQRSRVDRLPLPPVHLNSVVAGRRGVLSTAVAWTLDSCPNLLVQQVAIAAPARLLAYHVKAGRLLEEFGVRFEATHADDALEVADWIRGTIVEHLLSLPVGSLLPRVRDAFRARLLAARVGDPEVVRRIESFRGGEPVAIAPVRGDRGSDPADPSGTPPPVPA